MNENEIIINDLIDKVAVLKSLLPRYGGKTLECIIRGIEARIRELKKTNEL